MIENILCVLWSDMFEASEIIVFCEVTMYAAFRNQVWVQRIINLPVFLDITATLFEHYGSCFSLGNKVNIMFVVNLIIVAEFSSETLISLSSNPLHL